MNSFLKRLTLAVVASAVVASCSDNGNSPTGPDTTNKSTRRALVAECGEATYLMALSSALPTWEDSIETWKGNTALLNTAPTFSGQSTSDYLTALVPVLQQWESTLDTLVAPVDSVANFNAATSNRQTYLAGLATVLASWETVLETNRGTDFLPTPPAFVADATAPEITCPADTTITSEDSLVVVNFTVTAVDDCDSDSVVVTSVPPSGSSFPVGATLVTSTAVDSLGNESSCTFTVTVNAGGDSDAPEITCPSDTTITCAPDSGLAFTFVVTAVDDNDPAPVVTSVPPSGSVFPVGETTVTSTAMDVDGNESSCTFTVTVEGGDSELEIECPDDITVSCAPEEGVEVEFDVEVTGGCNGAPTVTSVPESGSVFPIGETTVTTTAMDSEGNETTCSFTVTVEAEEDGEISDVHASPSILWPPNHRWVDITLDVEMEGGCGDGDGDEISWTVTRVTSNEPINGTGDGDTGPDWLITDDGVKLRAERSGNGNGRIYTIFFEGDDGTEGSVRVRVPHNR